MGKKIKVIVGEKFGRWTIIKESSKRDKCGTVYYFCECECGNTKEVSISSLVRGYSTSCGCYNKEIIRTPKKRKYKAKELYYTLNSMKQRCYNPKHPAFHNYGARGIKICDEWLEDNNKFVEWAYKNNYKKGLWIDRINNNGNYEPSNCRWSTPEEQQLNKRANHLLSINGKTKPLTKWCKLYNIKLSTLKRRIELGWKEEDLFKPIDLTRSHSQKIKEALKK